MRVRRSRMGGSDQTLGVRGRKRPGCPHPCPFAGPERAPSSEGSTAVPSPLATSSLLSRTPWLQASTQHRPESWVLLLRACAVRGYLPQSAGCTAWAPEPRPPRSDALSRVPGRIYPRGGLRPSLGKRRVLFSDWKRPSDRFWEPGLPRAAGIAQFRQQLTARLLKAKANPTSPL